MASARAAGGGSTPPADEVDVTDARSLAACPRVISQAALTSPRYSRQGGRPSTGKSGWRPTKAIRGGRGEERRRREPTEWGVSSDNTSSPATSRPPLSL